VIGGGGHAKVVIRSLKMLNYHIAGIFDDDPNLFRTEIMGAEVLGRVADVETAARLPCVIAVGNNKIRARIAQSLELDWLTVVHPRAFIDDTVVLGGGTMVMAGGVIQPDCRIEDHVIVNTSASVDHDCRIESFAHVAPGCHLAGNCWVGRRAMLGIGATVLPGCRIGDNATIGGGACVVNDVLDGCTAKGIPAR